jgi:hypothetical protein
MRRRAPDILKRLELRIKHGVARPTPLYEALRRNPPPPMPRARKQLREITLPTDRIERAFREGAAVAPAVPLDAPAHDPSLAHALRAVRVGEEAAVEQRERQDEAAAAQALALCATIAEHKVPIGDRRVVDAWLMDILEWDWETQRRAQAELALLDDGSSDPLRLGRAVDALARTALGEAETGLASELHLEAQADGVFASKHGALAARARTRPWADWADHEQEALREFLEDVRVHGVTYDEHDFDEKRLAAFPQFESADHKSTADPEQIAKLLAAQGVFPDLGDARSAAELLERGIKAENAGLTSDLVAALRDPLSREHRRAAAAKRARGERGLLDRLAVAEGGGEEPAPSKE